MAVSKEWNETVAERRNKAGPNAAFALSIDVLV